MKDNSKKHDLAESLLVSLIDLNPQTEDFLTAVMDGLSGATKALPCKFFYDENGSRLFERICSLKEYYPTRTEISILEERLAEIAELVGRGAHLIELGSGASVKIRTLLNALPDLAQYTAVDISRDFLLQSAVTLASDYPDLDVAAVCADYTKPFQIAEPRSRKSVRNVAFFPGSTIGNFTPDEAEDFLAGLTGVLGSGSGLLIGVDLKKDADILHAAYDDADGITAAFNLNLLSRINRELGANFDLNTFRHRAVYSEDLSRVEMHLVSQKSQIVTIADKSFNFAAGEHIHTENSHKYSVSDFRRLCSRAGYVPVSTWTDRNDLFSIHYFTAK